MSNKKIFEAGGNGVEYGIAGDPVNKVSGLKGVNPDLLQADGTPAYAPRPVVKPAAPDPPPVTPKPVTPKPVTPKPVTPKPDADPSGGLAALPWKQIAIVAGAAGLLAALIALIKKCSKSIKLRFNKSVRTLARMQKDFTINKKGLDMRAVLPGVGSRLNDFITRVFSGSAFMNNGKTGVMGNTKSARKFKDGVIGLYPFCDIYKEEIRNDLTMAQTTFNKIKFAADSAENSDNGNNSNESVNGPVYRSFYEAFAAERLNESENGHVNESTALMLAALAPMVIRGGAFVINKIKDGKADPKDAKTVQVTKQSTREICYAILNNFFEKYISFEQVSKKMGVDIKGLSDIDESSIDKFKAVLKKYQNPDGASVVKQYARIKGMYDKMLTHYFNIGEGIIKNFEKYTKAEDEKHENLLVASKEKLQAMWDQQKDQYEHLFPYVLNEIINDGAYAQYIDFIIESVLPVFKTGIAGDADYVLDVMPKKGDYFLLSQTAQNGNIGNKAVAKITSDYDKDSKTINMSLVALYKGGITLTPEGNVEVDGDPENFDTKTYKSTPVELEYGKFMALDPHQIVNMEEILKKNMKLDIAAFIDKDILVMDKDVEAFGSALSELGKSDVTAVVYKIKAAENGEITFVIEYVSNKKDIASRVKYDEEKAVFRANKEDFESAADSEGNMKEYKLAVSELGDKQRPVTFTGDIQTLDSNTKITFAINEKGKTISYEGFVRQGNDVQEIFLKGTLNVDSEEEKQKNDEKGRNSTFMKIARVNISKEVNGKDIVEYLTDTYEASFEKQENNDFAKALATEAKDNKNLATQSFTDITAPDQTSDVITTINNELMDMYEQQANNNDGGAKDINKVLQTCWMMTDKERNISLMAIPYMDDEGNKDENPPLTGIIVRAEADKDHAAVGRLNVSADFKKVAEDMQKLGYKYYSNMEDVELTTMVANIRKTKPEDIKVTADWKSDEDYRKFIHDLCTQVTGFDTDPKKISEYMREALNAVSKVLNITIKPAENKDTSTAQPQNPGNGGQPGTPTSKPAASGAENTGSGEQPGKEAEESLNEAKAGFIDPANLEKALNNKNVTIAIRLEELEDGTKLKLVGNNILTIEFAKLLYKTSDEKYKNLTVILEFCDGHPGEGSGQYALVSTVVGSDGNPIKNVMRGMVVLGTKELPSVDLSNNYIPLECKDAKMNIVMGDLPKQEESLNEKRVKVQESVNFTVTYATNDKVIESAAFNTGINRKIVADKDCSQYYVISECMWSCANDEAVKKALANKMTATLKTCRTKEGLMEYAKANSNVEFSKNFADMNYAVRKPGNLYSIIGCSLFECAVAVKFNNNNIISNAIGIGVNKIN